MTPKKYLYVGLLTDHQLSHNRLYINFPHWIFVIQHTDILPLYSCHAL